MAAMPPTTIYVHTSDQPCPGAALTDGGRVATAEHPGPFHVSDEAHDDKGHSEERCVRCGWVMGHPPLNCNNDDTPHVFPSQQAAEPDAPADRADQMYRWLHGAREALCSAQHQLAVVSWRAMLGKAVAHIDYVGSRECGEQWSIRDRDDELVTERAEHFCDAGNPCPPSCPSSEPEAVWSLRRIYEVLATPVWNDDTRKAATMLAWHVEHTEQETVVADGPVNGAPSVTVHRSYTTDRPTAVDVDVTNRTLSMHTHGVPGGPPYELATDEARALAYDLATAADMLDQWDR